MKQIFCRTKPFSRPEKTAGNRRLPLMGRIQQLGLIVPELVASLIYHQHCTNFLAATPQTELHASDHLLMPSMDLVTWLT
jgi:hypothetical protein